MKQRRHQNRPSRPFAAMLIASVAVAVFGSPFLTARAAAPVNAISYQGRLLDSFGNPVSDASLEFVFRLFDGGGACLWESDDGTACDGADETQTVAINDGLFSENIGSTVDPAGLSEAYPVDLTGVFEADSDVYLEIEIDGETLAPRKQIVAAPFALNSQSLDGLDSTAFLSATGDTATGAFDLTGATIAGASALSFEGGTIDGFQTTFSITDPTADNLIVFQDASGTVALTSDIPAGSSLWETGAFGTFEDDDDVLVGSAGDETLSNAAFTLSGNDLFVADTLGVEGSVYSDGSFVAGTTTYGNGAVTTGAAQDLSLAIPGGDLTFAQDTVVGDGGDQLSIDTSDWDISVAGNMTNIGSISADGTVTMTGDVTLNDVGADTIAIGAAADTVTIASDALSLTDNNWNVTAAGAANFASIGVATPGSGAFTSLSANDDVTLTAAADFDQSGSTGTFKTGTGAVTLNGNAAVVAGKTLALTDLISTLLKTNGAGTIVAATSGTDYLSGSLADNNFLIGNGVGIATAVILSGDVTSTNAGVLTVGSGKINGDKILNGTIDWADIADATTLDADTSIATAGFALSTTGLGALTFSSTGQVSFAGNVNATSGVDVTGASLTVGGANFSVDPATGNTVVGGTLGVTGLSTLAATTATTLGATGDVTMNDVGADTIAIGAAADTVTIASDALSLTDNNWNVTVAGAANFASIGVVSPGSGAFTTLSVGGGFGDSGVSIDASGNVQTNGTLTISNGGTDITTAAGETLSVKPATSVGAIGGNLTLAAGDGNGAFDGGLASFLGGAADAFGGTSGSVFIDAGDPNGGGAGVVQIGNTFATNVQLAGGYGGAGVTVSNAGDVSANGNILADGDLTANGIVSLGDGGDTAAVSSSGWSVSTAGTLTGIAAIAGDDNQGTLLTNLNVIGADAGLHSVGFQIDGNTGLLVSATGDGAGGVGARTVDIGVSGATDVVNVGDATSSVTIGGATADVAITDTQWSVSGAGAASFASLSLSGNLDMANNLILNIGDAGTDFVAGGGLTLAGTLTANGVVTLGDGGDTAAVSSTNWSVTTAGLITTAGDVAVNGGDITSTGSITLDSSGTVQLGTNDNLVATGSITSTMTGTETIGVSSTPVADTAGDAMTISFAPEDNFGADEANYALHVIQTDSGANPDEGADGLIFLENTSNDESTGLLLGPGLGIGIDFRTMTGATDISLQNVESIRNNVDDVISLTGTLGADDTDIQFDLDGTMPVISSSADASVSVAENLLVGATAVAGVKAAFVLSGDDIFAAGDIAAQFNMYADTFVAGDASTTFADGSITTGVATDLSLAIGGGDLTFAQNTVIGDGGDVLSIDSFDWDISTSGDMTNIGAITSDGLITAGAGISIGAQALTGTTGIINYTNFDVAASGLITVAGGMGIDSVAGSSLALGNTNAVAVNIGSTAATTLNIGNGGALARAINIGTGTGIDTISIGTGGIAADLITIGSPTNAWDVTSDGTATFKGSATFGDVSGADELNFTTGATVTDPMTLFTNTVTTGTIMTINASGLTTGSALEIVESGAATTTNGGGLYLSRAAGAGHYTSTAGYLSVSMLNDSSGANDSGYAAKITSAATSPSLYVVPTNTAGTGTNVTQTKGGAVHVDNTLNPDTGLSVFSAEAASNSPLVRIVSSSVSFDDYLLEISSSGDGTGILAGHGGGTPLHVKVDQVSGTTGNTVETEAAVFDSSTNSAGPDGLISPAMILVRNNVAVAANTVFRVDADGDIWADGNFGGLSYNANVASDLAEKYPSSQSLSPGEIVGFDPAGTAIQRTSGPYQSTAVGVISTNPGFLLAAELTGYELALSGRVPTNVTDENGPIAVGDPIASSSIPGYGMKSSQAGMIVGFALEAYSGTGPGSISVFVNPHYYVGSILATDGSSTVVSGDMAMGSTGTATATTTGFDSGNFALRGSGWDGAAAQNVQMSIATDVTNASDYRLSIKNTAGSEVAYVSQAGDVAMAGRLYPSDRGTLQTSKYIYYDGSSGMGGDFMRTNASGWATGSYDFAEMFPSADTLEPGDVVTFGTSNESVLKSTGSSAALAGIVSTRPGFLAGENLVGNYPIALAGRVPTKVSLENGPIAIGDPLTASATAGYAMKAIASGPIVGYALEAYSGTAGVDDKIIAFVNAGYWNGGATSPTPGTSNTASTIVVSQNATNLSVLNMTGNVYLAGNDILGVRRIAGLSDVWSLEADGTVKTEATLKSVITSYQGDKVETAAVTSPDVQITLVGTATLVDGEATIRFEDVSPTFNDVTSTTAPIRVIVTPNGPVSLYVTEKNHDGFGVRQVGGSDSDVTFDWMVSAFRKDYEPVPVVAPADVVPVVDASVDPVVTDPGSVTDVPVDETVVPEETVPDASVVTDPASPASPDVVVPQDETTVPIADSTESNSGNIAP